jgi:hypothetical protein
MVIFPAYLVETTTPISDTVAEVLVEEIQLRIYLQMSEIPEDV